MAAPVSNGPQGWADLPGELVDGVVQRQDIFSTHRLAATCKSWEKAVALNPALPFDKPCLLMTFEEVDDDGFEIYRGVNDENRSTYHLKDLMPENAPSPVSFRALIDVGENHPWWVGAKDAWLAIVDDERNSRLLNPYTGVEVQLPPNPAVVDSFFPRRRAFKRIVVCQTPSDASGYLVIGIDDDRRLKIARGGDDSWAALTKNPDGYFSDYEYEDAIVHKGRVFALNEYGTIYAWDIESGACREVPSLPPGPGRDRTEIGGSSWKLAETADGRRLIVVCTYGRYESRRNYNMLSRRDEPFAVFEPEGVLVYAGTGSEGDRWSPVTSLGGNSLFLGWNYPIIAPVVRSSQPEWQKIQPNSICFAQGKRSPLVDDVDDVQVFGLGADNNYMDRTKLLFVSSRHSMDYQIPIWFRPMLRRMQVII